ncbi:MAG: thioredoxin family protein [Prevotella sp.]|nr:thioredoxin family protein [Prevotella sp.]
MNKQSIITCLRETIGRWPKGKAIVIPVLALVAMAGHAKTYKTIKTPVAMACVNVSNGELKAREVIFRDTATTVHFTMEYPKGQYFRFVKESYLMDEDGNRYPLRSAEDLALDTWVQSPESGVTDFTMHFEPMPKKVQVFDFVEGDVQGAFMLLGLHDKKAKLKYPTLQELSDANPYTVPANWFTTDTITIRGRIEGYDAEKFGFTSMECLYEDVFEKDATTLVFNIAPDGTFEKRFQASYPIRQCFFARGSKVGFNEIPFYARPGETIEVTVHPDEQGQYQCIYGSGSSKDVERWLKSDLKMSDLAYPLHTFKGKFSEAGEMTERTWRNMLYCLQKENRRRHFTPQEMQLALSDLQLNFAYAVMDYAMYHEDDVKKYEQRDGVYQLVILDSLENKEIDKMENYKALHRIDFDNPLLLTCDRYPITINRIQFARPVRNRQFEGILDENGAYVSSFYNSKKILSNGILALRELMGTDHDAFMAQLCIYKDMQSSFNSWRSNEDALQHILADTTLTAEEHKEAEASLQPVGKMMPLYLGRFSDSHIHQKAEAFYSAKMAQTELSAPLPAGNLAADLIRSLCAKYPGRYLIIDFWGMGCGPCRAAIQNSKAKRAEMGKRDDVKLVFIAGERTAKGSEEYHQYVNEWLADEETVCITNTDFSRMQELFRFNGIPHYETITPDCRRVRDDLRVSGYYNIDFELEQLKEKLK